MILFNQFTFATENTGGTEGFPRVPLNKGY